jgi:defect in organelle trafficking protein DotB
MTPNPDYLLANEPSVFMGSDIDDILMHTTALGASDVTIQTDNQIFAEIHGKLRIITAHALNHEEVSRFVSYMINDEGAMTRLAGAQPWDVAHEVKPDRNTKFRFRVNVVGTLNNGQRGAEITLRTIPSIPPLLSSMSLPQKLLDNRVSKQGLILVTGATGSGKSTLLASIIRDLLEDPNSHRKIVTYEAPIEFTYDEVHKPAALIAQTEIPTMLETFSIGVTNALRRKPNVILIGEMRDRETIAEAIVASMTGHLVYSTLHSNGFADTIRRVVNMFPKEEQQSKAIDIISSLRMCVSQMLLPSTDGKRIAIQEYLVMTEEIAEQLMNNTENLALESRRLLKMHGQTYLQDATVKYEQGKIDITQYRYIKALGAGMDRDLLGK